MTFRGLSRSFHGLTNMFQGFRRRFQVLILSFQGLQGGFKALQGAFKNYKDPSRHSHMPLPSPIQLVLASESGRSNYIVELGPSQWDSKSIHYTSPLGSLRYRSSWHLRHPVDMVPSTGPCPVRCRAQGHAKCGAKHRAMPKCLPVL